MREGEENSAETLDHCHLGAKRLSLPLGEGLDGGKTRPTLSAIPLFPQKGPGADSAGAFLRKEGDSNPRNPQGVQQFSRLPRSTTPASFQIFGLQI